MCIRATAFWLGSHCRLGTLCMDISAKAAGPSASRMPCRVSQVRLATASMRAVGLIISSEESSFLNAMHICWSASLGRHPEVLQLLNGRILVGNPE